MLYTLLFLLIYFSALQKLQGRAYISIMFDMKKALIAMSGGVDSSVAAQLTIDAGYECVGCTMKLFERNEDDLSAEASACGSFKDAEDAKKICESLGMQHFLCDFSDDFRKKIIDHFVCSYLHAETPNPCVECNKYMKFDKLYEKAIELGCDKIVTGHYARVEKTDDGYVLKKAADETKDQSYVLYNLTQELLAHVFFPLGELSKSTVREMAGERGFENADKPESQDICFVPDGDYAKVIREYLGDVSSPALKPGDFVNASGDKLGEHKGIIHYTIGQRKGLGISAPDPLYVCSICTENNTVVLGSNDDLFSDTVYVKNINWISGNEPEAAIKCKAKIRYRHKEQPATVYPLTFDEISKIKESTGDLSPDAHYAKIIFNEPQRAITPGQSAVFYDEGIVLGGGIII